METALINGILYALTLIAVPTCTAYVLIQLRIITLLSVSGWKTELIFFVGFFSAFARLVVYCIKSWQDIKRQAWKDERDKHTGNDGKNFKEY